MTATRQVRTEIGVPSFSAVPSCFRPFVYFNLWRARRSSQAMSGKCSREKKIGSVFSFSCLNEISFLSCIRLRLCFGRFLTIMRQVSILSQISPDCFIFEKRISRLHFLSFSQIFLKAGAPTLSGCGGAPHCVPLAPSLKITFK